MFYISVSDLVRLGLLAAGTTSVLHLQSAVRVLVPYCFDVSLYPFLALCLCIFWLRAFCGLTSLQLKACIAYSFQGLKPFFGLKAVLS